MPLLIFAIVMSMIFLSVEIPVLISRREQEDFLIVIASGMMLTGCMVVLFFWR